MTADSCFLRGSGLEVTESIQEKLKTLSERYSDFKAAQAQMRHRSSSFWSYLSVDETRIRQILSNFRALRNNPRVHESQSLHGPQIRVLNEDKLV